MITRETFNSKFIPLLMSDDYEGGMFNLHKVPGDRGGATMAGITLAGVKNMGEKWFQTNVRIPYAGHFADTITDKAIIGVSDATAWEWWLEQQLDAPHPVWKSFVEDFYYRYYFLNPGIYQFSNELLAFKIFECGVASSPRVGIRLWQKVIGAQPDGLMGPKTVQKTIEFIEDSEIGLFENNLSAVIQYVVLLDYATERRKFYIEIVRRNPSQIKFLNGWLNRAEHVPLSLL